MVGILHKKCALIGAVIFFAALLAATFGCAPKTAPPPPVPPPVPEVTSGVASGVTTMASGIPTPLMEVESNAEDIYDTIYKKDWTKADKVFVWFANGMKMLDAAVPGQADQKTALQTQVDTLGTAIKAKDRPTALEAANQISLQATEMTAPFNPPVPIDIARLDFYARELQIGAEAKDTAKLQSTTADIRTTWDGVRQQVVDHNGPKTAANVDKILTRLEAAKTPEDYAKQAPQLMDQVDIIEKLFMKKK